MAQRLGPRRHIRQLSATLAQPLGDGVRDLGGVGLKGAHLETAGSMRFCVVLLSRWRQRSETDATGFAMCESCVGTP